jgi:hypothetical protein
MQLSLKSDDFDALHAREKCNNHTIIFMYKLRIVELGGHLLALSKKDLLVKKT